MGKFLTLRSFKIRIHIVLGFFKPHSVPLFLIAQTHVTVLQSNFMSLSLQTKEKLRMKYGSLTQSQTFNLHWTIFSASKLFILCNNIFHHGKYLQYLSKCFREVYQIKSLHKFKNHSNSFQLTKHIYKYMYVCAYVFYLGFFQSL